MHKPVKKDWKKPIILEFSIGSITKQGRPGGRPSGGGPPPGAGPPGGGGPPGISKNQRGPESSNTRAMS